MYKIFLFFVITFFIIPTTFAWETKVLASDLTIKELSQNIEKLKEEKEDFLEKNKELSKEYWELFSFIRNDLNEDEIEEITWKVNAFLENKANLETRLKQKIDNQEDSTDIKKEIIFNRANFYKYIAKYVQKDKREDFIAHIKFQVQSEKEAKDLIEEILLSQNLLEQKVTYIKEKIETHKEDLQAKIENSITLKIKKRIDEIDSNPKYAQISQTVKNTIYKNFILQIKKRLSELEASKLSDNYKEMRRNILNKMIEEITLKIKDQK